MAGKVLSIRLNSGYDMSMLGSGTDNSFKPNEVGDAVKAAIQMGYRHIDTAWLHKTEPEIGFAVQELIKEGKIKREELFMVTKMWVHCHEPDQVEPACRMSLEALDMDYIDLYLIHFPVAFVAMEKLEAMLLICPVLVEITPYLAEDDLLQFSLKNGISTTAYATGHRYRTTSARSGFDSRSNITGHTKTPFVTPRDMSPNGIFSANDAETKANRVILRYGIQRGYDVIPKSTNPARLAQNMDMEISSLLSL